MTVTAEEFIRRFLMHVPPQKFVKIRYYGILSNRNRMSKLKKCKIILKVSFHKNDTEMLLVFCSSTSESKSIQTTKQLLDKVVFKNTILEKL